MIPGYKCFSNDTPRYFRYSAISEQESPEKQENTAAIVERAAIMEYDGGLSRTEANSAAARDYDTRRNRIYGDGARAGDMYRNYLKLWMPHAPDDLPKPPPNTTGNNALWAGFWEVLEAS